MLAACGGGSSEPRAEEQATAPPEGAVVTDQAVTDQAVRDQAAGDQAVAGDVAETTVDDDAEDADVALEEPLPRVPIRLDRSEIYDLLWPVEQLDPGLIVIVEERDRIAKAQRARGEEPEPPPEIGDSSTTGD